jgi:cardiolipin synthase
LEQNCPKTVSFLTVANALTAARLLLLPVIIIAVTMDQGMLAVLTMAAVVLTDLLDGRIARRLGQASAFGGTLDSTIDFVLIYSLFITFYAAGRLDTYQFVIIYVAMLTMFVLQIGSMGSGQSDGVVRTRTGKVTGALQYLYLLFLVAREVLPESSVVYIIDQAIFWPLAVSIVLSSIGCIRRVKRMV